MLKMQSDLERDREVRASNDHMRQMELLHSGSQRRDSQTPCVVRGPKLPSFEEGRDNIDSYLQRFQRFATTQKWDKATQWAPNLSVLLKGKALDVFTRLPVDQSMDYDVLKNALLKRFEMTEYGFRRRFREGRPEKGETFSQFAVRLESYFLRWMEMAGSGKSSDELKDLMLRDQFVCACGNDLTLFLKERVPSSVKEMAKLADQYAEARGDASSLLKPRTGGQKLSQNSSSKEGHHQSSKAFGTSTEDKDKQRSGSSGKHCFICKKPDHLSYNCPRKTKKGEVHCVSSKTSQKGRGKNSSMQSDPNLVTTSCDTSVCMPVVKGRIGGKDVDVLRDTGCSGVIIRNSFVQETDLTGEIQICILANGQRISVPVANVVVQTPYYSGTVRAWCMQSPVYDIILGNIEGVRPADNPDPGWNSDVKSASAVQTRAQKERENRPYRSLKYPRLFQIWDHQQI
ncbi:uncharacterized protein LOC117316074 [Pecten maximus]|uniref:uncharacterized protein LOC117316074 n=1 Tax=Pecten maximus TaxID=6579 RepID=UPI001458CDEB|nr:uncharacterized protein LOC117316074 [Pecten maximus]